MTTPPATPPRRMSQSAKAMVDIGPLAVFFVVYFFGKRIAPLIAGVTGLDLHIAEGRELFAALIAYMPCFALAFAYSFWRERRVTPMLIISFVMVVCLGSLSLLFNDKTFFFMKPTIAYTLFAATLGGGLVSKRNFLKAMFDGALTLPEGAWTTLTQRYAMFFAVLAVGHEFLWRWLMRGCDYNAGLTCPGEPIWVQAKLFGFTTINVLFAAAQGPFLVKHMQNADETETSGGNMGTGAASGGAVDTDDDTHAA